MSNRQELLGHWNQVKGRLQENWGQLTDDDLQSARGSAEHLVGVVQAKTGAARAEVESFLDNILNEGLAQQASLKMEEYSDAASQMAAEAADYARQRAREFAAASGDYTKQLGQTVRSRPTESLAIAFGLGIMAGAFFFVNRKR